jgi:hypothetical protein
MGSLSKESVAKTIEEMGRPQQAAPQGGLLAPVGSPRDPIGSRARMEYNNYVVQMASQGQQPLPFEQWHAQFLAPAPRPQQAPAPAGKGRGLLDFLMR